MSVAPEPVPLSALLRGHAATAPDGPAITADGRTLSWRELEARTNRVARALIARGVKPDDLVTIVLPNGAAFLEACFACGKAGATPPPASVRAPAAELAALIALADPAFVVADPGVAIAARPRATYDELLAAEADDRPPPDRVAGA
ncbi:MAG: AMP-binding protein, partial [Phenylobacterium sp.]|nr:AMP-binding protein [Phenylobacterium sp.]